MSKDFELFLENSRGTNMNMARATLWYSL